MGHARGRCEASGEWVILEIAACVVCDCGAPTSGRTRSRMSGLGGDEYHAAPVHARGLKRLRSVVAVKDRRLVRIVMYYTDAIVGRQVLRDAVGVHSPPLLPPLLRAPEPLRASIISTAKKTPQANATRRLRVRNRNG